LSRTRPLEYGFWSLDKPTTRVAEIEPDPTRTHRLCSCETVRLGAAFGRPVRVERVGAPVAGVARDWLFRKVPSATNPRALRGVERGGNGLAEVVSRSAAVAFVVVFVGVASFHPYGLQEPSRQRAGLAVLRGAEPRAHGFQARFRDVDLEVDSGLTRLTLG